MAADNQNITFKGNKLTVLGKSLRVGDMLPDFKLTGGDLGDVTKSQFLGRNLILSIVPSLDTPVCAEQTKRFNEEVEKFGDKATILTVSMDLPFAQARWCGLEGVTRIKTASDYKYHTFGQLTGTLIQENGLLARTVVIADKTGKIVHVEYVNDITQHPNYDAVISKLKEIA